MAPLAPDTDLNEVFTSVNQANNNVPQIPSTQLVREVFSESHF